MATRKLEVLITGDASHLNRTFGDVETKSGGLVSKIKSTLGGIPLPVAAAASAGLVIVGNSLKGMYEAAVESQKVSKETARVIETTGGAAGVTAGQVDELSTALSNKTAIDDEVIQSGANLLLTFTNIRDAAGEGNDIFSQATGLALDMSTALGTDASGAAIQLGKALNDPVKGITALSRAGVSFTQQQKDQIKTMVESGDTLGAQKMIIAELNKEFGGAAATASTPLDRLKVTIGNLQEQIGMYLIPVVDKIANLLGKVLPPIVEWVGEHMAAVGIAVAAAFTIWAVSAGVAAAASIAAAAVPLLIVAAIGVLVAAVVYAYNNWQWFHDAVQAAVAWVTTNVPPAWEMVKNAIGAVVDWLTTVAWPLIQKFYEFHRRLVEALVGFISQYWEQISSIVSSVWDTIKNVISNGWDIIKNIFQLGFNIITGKWGAAWENVKNIAGSAWDIVKNVISNGWDVIKNLFLSGWKFISSVGSNMWNGLYDGFRSAINAIISRWNNLSFSIPSVDMGPLGSFGGGRIDFPNVPYLHSGGVFQAPAGRSEGLAMLRNGERVLTPEQQNSGAQPIVINIGGSLVLERDLLGILAKAQANGYRPSRVA